VRYAAFLRAVNLGRNHRVTSAELREIFEGVGAEEVATFRTSGNVVFEAPRDMSSKIEKALESTLGYDVGVFTRTARELAEIAEAQPFKPGLVEASKGKLQVSMLSAKPTAAKRKQVLALATDDDLLAFGKRELFWLPSGGYVKAELDWKALDELLGPSTVRTKGTVDQLHAKYFG
jgi:uncharacterized protein (DUF1697 family)